MALKEVCLCAFFYFTCPFYLAVVLTNYYDMPSAHIIKLGSPEKNDGPAYKALQVWPGIEGNMQIGGGITDANASYWLNEAGANKV
jgi:phosphoribosylformimino-5-aminoimidazole carboxamide ribonucleotide (ProFAR) isomerase